jgi:hypothetical protein
MAGDRESDDGGDDEDAQRPFRSLEGGQHDAGHFDQDPANADVQAQRFENFAAL